MPRFEVETNKAECEYVAVFISRLPGRNGQWDWQIQGHRNGRSFIDAPPTFIASKVLFTGYETWEESWLNAKTSLVQRYGSGHKAVKEIEAQVLAAFGHVANPSTYLSLLDSIHFAAGMSEIEEHMEMVRRNADASLQAGDITHKEHLSLMELIHAYLRKPPFTGADR